jgi:predicted Ser/Thr protein kinase
VEVGVTLSQYSSLADSVKIIMKKGKPLLADYSKSLKYIGQGRSAYVFKIKHTNKAIKIFFPEFVQIAEEEADIYKKLQHIPYYPALYEGGPNYLVIDFIKGLTLFECLVAGVKLNEEHIKEIDHALGLARLEGLNPSDIHLRNIIITQDKKIKLIDVARFRQTKNCYQWNDLKQAFHRFYKRPYFPKKIPAAVLNLIAAIYKKNRFRLFNVEHG